MCSFLDLTLKIAPWSKLDGKWINLMKKWKSMFQNFLQGHPPQSRPRGRWRASFIYGERKKISKWFFFHRLSWSIAFWIYDRNGAQMSRNRDIEISRFWSTPKLGFKCRNWLNSKFKSGIFLIFSSWLIESRTSDIFEFGWVEFILMKFESSPSVSVRVGEETLEYTLKIKSVLNDIKAKMLILRCFGLEYQVSSKFVHVRCRNWNVIHVCQILDFMCKNQVLIQNSQIWCMNS